ncbi:MAG TPA: hypothetical protein DCP37_13905, partial [Dehalococcoidia bacterium]|nr:hypothetical protein [Dehalococcoidia bacterium]
MGAQSEHDLGRPANRQSPTRRAQDAMNTVRYRSSALRIHAGQDALANLGNEAARLGAQRA